jgi:hypothetical protein
MYLRNTIFGFDRKSYCPHLQYFWLKNDGEKGSRIFYFQILSAPSEILANLPGQFSHSGQIFLHWAAATLKGHIGFQNKKI